MNYPQVLSDLCALDAPSGFEAPAAQAAARLLRPLVDQVEVDPMGSVLGVRRCGREGALKLLLDAHLDEVGFVVTGHEEGFLTYASLGGVDPRILPDREVLILTQPIPVGTPAVCRGELTALGEDLLSGKALDARACFAMVLDALERLKDRELDVDVYVLGSSQEETHSTGAITAAYGVVPDLCVAVDVTHGNSPDAGKGETFKLGGGPVLGLGPNCTRWMAKRMEDKSKELDMDIQKEVMSGSSGTNGWPLQVSREGIATAVLSIPLRYMHTPMETVCRRDLEDGARLLAAFIQGIGKEVPSYD